jgi:hypothetical protein
VAALLWRNRSGRESFNVFEESANVYVVTGFTYSTDYDVTSNYGSADGWILRITSVLGENETSIEKIKLFPNPTHDYISFDSGLSGLACISDFQGRIVFWTNDIASGTIRIPNLVPGIYVFRLAERDSELKSLIYIY